MRLHDLAGKRVAVLGYGKEGKAVLGALARASIACNLTIADSNATLQLESDHSCRTLLGDAWLDALDDADVIVKSPGIPPHPRIDAARGRITSGTRIFFAEAAAIGATIVGVTGSKGKSTTTSLIHAILSAAGKPSILAGNIGKPSLDILPQLTPLSIVALEMSSYQLMDMDVSPHIAVVTAFFPEHLDYHGSLEAYKAAKANIARYQTQDDVVFYCADSEGATEIALHGRGRKAPFCAADAPLTIGETKLLGQHNLGNIAGALAATAELGVDMTTALDAVRAFTPLPHRLQHIGMHGGIAWVDDAISTTPQSAMAALDALGDDVATIILGGQDRGVDFSPLAARLRTSRVHTVLLFPGSGPRIRTAIADAHVDVCMHDAASMEQAVSLALRHTMPGKMCLLSTASPSYGMFKNFEQKGDVFAAEILRQTAGH